MDRNNFSNFNNNEATFTGFGFGYSTPESVQLERNENFTMVAENFTHSNHSNHKNLNTATTTKPNPDDSLAISPPFPPNIDPKDLAQELFNKGGKKTKKMLNEFFLFRKEFVRELKRQNLRPKQTKVSSLASTSWHKQKPSVKDEYRRIAREVERLFMIERQREVNEASRAESNESSTDDSVSSPTEPDPNNFQLSLSNESSNNISPFLETNNQNNVRRDYLPPSNFYWPPYNQYDRQYIRQTNVTPVTSSYTRPTYFQPYVDHQVVVPSQNTQDYYNNTNLYSR